MERISSVYLPIVSSLIGAAVAIGSALFFLGGEWSEWREIRDAHRSGGVVNLATEGFVTSAEIATISVPPGTIVAFNGGAEIPSGWAICNGDNGTPDLRGVFLRGAGTVGEIGLDTAASETHAHNATSADVASVPNMIRAGTSQGNDDSWWALSNHAHTLRVEGASHIPPNYRVVFLMKL